MKLSVSIEVVMQLAGQEAVAGQFEAIQPEHLLAALLKFAELPVEQVVRAAPGLAGARQLPLEAETLRTELSARRINTTQVRRQLRSALGNGGHPFDGGSLHRSEETRAIFDSAAKIADEARADTVTAAHLFEAVLMAPTKIIAELVSPSKREPVPRESNTPLLDEHGVDLTRLPALRELPNAKDRQIEAKALLEVLSKARRKGVLLICDEPDAAHGVVETAAWAIARREARQSLHRTRIVDISGVAGCGVGVGRTIGERELFEEAAKSSDLVLLVASIHGESTNSVELDRVALLLETLRFKPTRFICPVTSKAYQISLKGGTVWKQNTYSIWVGNDRMREVPGEL